MEQLKKILSNIDGKGYKAYKELQGKSFKYTDFELHFFHIQGDPFASPSRLMVSVPQTKAGFPQESYSPKIRETALADYLTRVFYSNIGCTSKGSRGSGKSGTFHIERPGQEVLERTSARINESCIEVRFFAGMPAAGRRILGRQAQQMLLEELPEVVNRSLTYANLSVEELFNHIYRVEDQETLRRQLPLKSLVAFVADGSILPRRSGIDQRPLDKSKAVPFQSPPELAVEFERPNGEPIRGMGIPDGVTLIVGGGYHGKSTLLRALERGIYNHRPGDGREGVVANPAAIKIRAEDGRRVEKVDISPFISNLPFGQQTVSFSSEEASGSTSQAANIIEALEAGAQVLLIDEDTSATNFMIRDSRMQQLVSSEKEPITPFIDKVRQLNRELDISSILVIGGAGDYFDIADTVLMMEEYRPREVTAEAREIASRNPGKREAEGGETFGKINARLPQPGSFNPRRGRKVKIKAQGVEGLQFGKENIDLHYVEQIVEPAQTRAIGDMVHFALRKEHINGWHTLKEVITLLDQIVDEQGLEVFSPDPLRPNGDYARPRQLELAAAVNRLRSLLVHVGKND